MELLGEPGMNGIRASLRPARENVGGKTDTVASRRKPMRAPAPRQRSHRSMSPCRGRPSAHPPARLWISLECSTCAGERQASRNRGGLGPPRPPVERQIVRPRDSVAPDEDGFREYEVEPVPIELPGQTFEVVEAPRGRPAPDRRSTRPWRARSRGRGSSTRIPALSGIPPTAPGDRRSKAPRARTSSPAPSPATITSRLSYVWRRTERRLDRRSPTPACSGTTTETLGAGMDEVIPDPAPSTRAGSRHRLPIPRVIHDFISGGGRPSVTIPRCRPRRSDEDLACSVPAPAAIRDPRFLRQHDGHGRRRIRRALARETLSARGGQPESIAAIFVTHEHSDHRIGALDFAETWGIPIFCSRGRGRSRPRRIALRAVRPGRSGARRTRGRSRISRVRDASRRERVARLPVRGRVFRVRDRDGSRTLRARVHPVSARASAPSSSSSITTTICCAMGPTTGPSRNGSPADGDISRTASRRKRSRGPPGRPSRKSWRSISRARTTTPLS